MFKIGDKVVCVETSGYDWLTVEKVYTVAGLWDFGIYFVDDNGGLAGVRFECFKPHTETETERRGAKFGVTGVVKDKGFRVSFVKERKGLWRVFDENGMYYDFKPSEIRLDHEPEYVAWSDAPEEMKYDANRVYWKGEPVKWIAKPEGATVNVAFTRPDGQMEFTGYYLTVKL